jgi:hypothetical protein
MGADWWHWEWSSIRDVIRYSRDVHGTALHLPPADEPFTENLVSRPRSYSLKTFKCVFLYEDPKHIGGSSDERRYDKDREVCTFAYA